METYKTIEPKGWQNHPGNMAAMAVSNLCLPSIVQVIKSTGFFRGLYTPQELDAKSIQVHATHIDTLCMYMCVIVYMFGVRGYRLYTVPQTIYFLCRTRIQRLLSCRRHWTHFVSCIHCIHMGIPYSREKMWGPNFILFILSLSERKFNTRNVHYDGVFSCVKWTERKLTHESPGDKTERNLDPMKISLYIYGTHKGMF